MANVPKLCCNGTVTKIIRSVMLEGSQTAEIFISGAEPLYREIRIQNLFATEEGIQLSLLPGTRVRVTIEVEIPAVHSAPVRAASHAA